MARILIVDDDKATTDLLKQVFLKEGHEAEGVYDGIEGLEVIVRMNPDIIFMDCRMPRMSGIELTRAVRKDPKYSAFSNVPLISIGDYERLAPDKETLALVDAYLSKPLDLELALYYVDKYCN